jgi:hypothetical protein
MLKKIWGIGIVAVLASALIVGSLYIMLRPEDAEAGQGYGGNRPATSVNAAQGTGGNGNRDAQETARGRDDCDTAGANGPGYQGGAGNGAGARNAASGQGAQAQDNGPGYRPGYRPGYQGAQGTGQGLGSGEGTGPEWSTEHSDWQTIAGEVTVADNELTVATDEGDILVGLGQAWYREDAGFVVEVGDEVRVHGFYEDGEFKAGTVENLSTGQQIQLRDATGRPAWAGRGNGQRQ